MENFKSRLLTERDELKKKLVRLDVFLGEDYISELDEPQRELLSAQSKVMADYLAILDTRIERLKI